MTIWKSPPDLDALNALSEGNKKAGLGIRLVEAGDDFLRATMPVDSRTRQPYGILHGGASVALAETVGSIAAMCCIDQEKDIVSGLDINANPVRAVRGGMVTATARAVHVGRSTQVWEIGIVDEEGRLACISRLTMAVMAKAGH